MWIPRLLGNENPEALPWAELWMGVHPDAPSMVQTDNGETSLSGVIESDPVYYLGEQTAEKFGGLPFLFKLLAAEQPLSIQAHPSLSQARDGYQRENLAGLARDDLKRNYKDPNHKPELICALTPFTGMCGFRRPPEICLLMDDFLGGRENAAPESLRSGMTPLINFLKDDDEAAALKNFFHALFALNAGLRGELSEYIIREGARRAAEPLGTGALSPEWNQMMRFAKLYPADPAVISPLYLNLFTLEPGEALFLPAGTLHAYIDGFGVELMANSDNVLRGGLTSKHVDIAELLKILNFSPRPPEIIRPPEPCANWTYPAPCGEFSLSALRGKGTDTEFCESGPAICIVLSGELEICGQQDAALFKAGQSVFIPPARRPRIFRGDYAAYLAAPGQL